MQRREILKALAAAPLTYLPASHGQPVSPPALRAAPAVVRAAGQAALPVWAYGGEIPGPVLRYKRGDVVDLELDNALPEATTIHWHGMRLPNAMDGVPHLTQLPVEPGRRFRYRYALPDAGTFWYHPHLGTAEQVERGLAGVLVVEDDAMLSSLLARAIARERDLSLVGVAATLAATPPRRLRPARRAHSDARH